MSPTILVVDDDPDFLVATRIQLEAAGYTVIPVETSKAAREALAAQRPDLVVADVMMEFPDSGFVLCHWIKKHDATIPVVLVSAVTSATNINFQAETDEERAWIQADALLAKPLRFEQLQHELERLLRRDAPAAATEAQ